MPGKAATFGLAKIGQIAQRAKDLQRAAEFYGETLGLRRLFEAPGLAFFDCDGVRLMLSKPERSEFDHPGSILYFSVDDIQVAYRTLAERGAAFVGEPHLVARLPDHDLWMAFFHDSEDNLLALMSEARRG